MSTPRSTPISAPPPAGAPAMAILRLLACFLLVAAVAAAGARVTQPEIAGWYAGLHKPAFPPPDGVSPTGWPVLYPLRAVALWRLWEDPAGPARRSALFWFLAQLALNALWSPVFFGAHALWTGLAIIVLLVFALAMTLRAAFAVDKLAGWLLVPYMAWICFATSLNLAIAVLN